MNSKSSEFPKWVAYIKAFYWFQISVWTASVHVRKFIVVQFLDLMIIISYTCIKGITYIKIS